MPSRNAVGSISRAISCVLAQDHADKHLFIVDSGSTDGTHDVIASFADHPQITWINELETGLANAINRGIAHVPSDAIFGYLGADDFLEPDVLRLVSDHFEAEPDHLGLYFDSYTARHNRETVYRACPADRLTLDNLLRFRSVAGMQNIFLRGEVIKAHLFDETVKFAMDYELCLRLASLGLGDRIVRCPHASTVNTADGNLSRVFKRASKREALYWALRYAPPGPQRRRAWLRYLKYRFV